MVLKNVKVCVLAGDGLNCEQETAQAFSKFGVKSEIVHINSFVNDEANLLDFDIFALPGGFSFGDELGSSIVLSYKIKKYLLTDLEKFIQLGRPVVGICNGFQTLLSLKLFGNDFSNFGLVANRDHQFHNEISKLTVNQGRTFWTKDCPHSLNMISRHGEGRFYSSLETGTISLENVVFRYENNFNGSFDSIAGICNDQGNVLGLMPHPEVDIFDDNIESTISPSLIFKNAIDYSLELKNTEREVL
ncbi:MAG: hypothetical protein GY909_13145 [Oligoflexia bacterium]|nr:hypothetical protein [Oligoflexia bacterium]